MNCSNCNTCENSEKKGCGTSSVFNWLYEIEKTKNTTNIVEVQFKKNRKEYYKNETSKNLKNGDWVVVEGESIGKDIGRVSLIGDLVLAQLKRKKINQKNTKKIYDIATKEEIKKRKEVINNEETILNEAKQIIKRFQLEMKLSVVETQGDNKEITFYYTAEKRIDFRELIKEYSRKFRKKIKMKQIGIRQEAAKLGGIGSCGRELCCSTWMTSLPSVTTTAVRYQQLAINPVKISGQCGRLKCCLNFELDSYMEALSFFPKPKTILKTKKGEAKYFKMDVFRKELWYFYKNQEFSPIKIPLQDVIKIIKMNKEGKTPENLENFKK